MKRCNISMELLSNVKSFLKTGDGNARVRNWVNKWKPVLKSDNVYHDNKLLVPKEQQQSILELAAKRGMPLGRDSAFQWLAQRYYGFKRRDVGKFIGSLETVQMMRKRPFKNRTQNLTQTREGTSQMLLQTKYGGHGSVGIDLTFLPRKTKNFPKESWTDDKYLYVAVVQSNNYTFAYPMENKTAKTARDCAAKLWKDFHKRYGFNITGLFMDKGTEFQEDHRTFWKSNKINPVLLKKVWWVENRNSVLMRNIAALREGLGYSWKYAFKNALEKTNDTYCRKIRAIPSSVTGQELKEGIRHHNRKLKRVPKKRKQPRYKVGDRVRTLTKNAMDVNTVLWKSYNAFRDTKTQAWTKTVRPIKAKKKKGRTVMYQVNNDWYYPWQLQKIDKVVVLESDEPKEKAPDKKTSALAKWLKPVRNQKEPDVQIVFAKLAKKKPEPQKRKRGKAALRAAMAKPISRRPQAFGSKRPASSWSSMFGRR